MSAFAKNKFCCMILNFLKTVHLISGDVNEQRVAIVQTTENEGTHQLNSGFPRQEMANRATSSDLKIRLSTNVVSMLCHRQGSVNVKPEAFYVAFERNIMTANSQMAIL